MPEKRKKRNKYTYSDKIVLSANKSFAEEDSHTQNLCEYFVPKSRLRRERRKWVKKSQEGANVYSTRCGKNPMLMIFLSEGEFDLLIGALDKPSHPIPDSLRDAKKLYDKLISHNTNNENV